MREEPSSGAPSRRALRLLVTGKPVTMDNLINIIIVLLILGWLVGYFAFTAVVGSLIHLLLVVAVIAIVYRLVTGRKADI